MYIENRLFSETSGESYYSVTMTEEEYSLYRLFSKEESPDEYEDLNYNDLIKNTADKNPFTIKKLRQARKEHLSKENGKGRVHSALRASGAAALGAGIGAAGGAGGALAGGIVGGAGGYITDRAARRLRNKVRKSGGGGVIDDAYAREYDRLDTLDKGGMTKEEFKKKWYRNKSAK